MKITVEEIPHTSEVRSGQVDLTKLLKRTPLHPNGRVQMNELGEIDSPQNPTDGTFTTSTVVDGKIYKMEIPRFTGTVKGKDSVWRIAMCQPRIYVGDETLEGDGPEEIYHQMCEIFEEKKAMGKTDDFRPELTKQETVAYLNWKVAQKLATESDKKKLAKLTDRKARKEDASPKAPSADV